MPDNNKIFRFFMGIVIGLSLIIPGHSALAVETGFSGQLSGWIIMHKTGQSEENTAGLRYIPQFVVKQALSDASFLDLEISLNGFFPIGSEVSEDDYYVRLYRAKLRYATPQTETQVGLQKINFGPARLLRSLMWFDRLDPTDPLQMTEGIYALRFKYNSLSNASLWLWCLIDNEDTKGLEILPTASDKPEYGGRWQHPLLGGEMALTVHTRRVDGSGFYLPDYTENRLGLDGQWDLGVGLWFEFVWQEQRADGLPYDWAKMITVGLDYTFNIGNGLYIVAEHMVAVSSNEPFGWDEKTEVSACSVSYPIGLLDSLQAIGYYSWEQKKYYQHLSWRRAYDRVALNVSLFYYPESTGEDAGFSRSPLVSGYGGQVMITFNH